MAKIKKLRLRSKIAASLVRSYFFTSERFRVYAHAWVQNLTVLNQHRKENWKATIGGELRTTSERNSVRRLSNTSRLCSDKLLSQQTLKPTWLNEISTSKTSTAIQQIIHWNKTYNQKTATQSVLRSTVISSLRIYTDIRFHSSYFNLHSNAFWCIIRTAITVKIIRAACMALNTYADMVARHCARLQKILSKNIHFP